MSALEMLRPALAVGAVLALVATLAWLVRRSGGFRGRSGAAVRMESVLALGDRRSIAIVAVEGRRLLIGLGTDVTLLTELAPSAGFQQALEAKLPDGPA